jgi:AhpD family alkylhydroperoxidase
MAHAPQVRLEWQGFKELAPEANDALLALGKAASVHGLDKALQEFIKIRVSQINGCAFCLQMHLDDARRMKLDETKLNLVAVWREAPVFSPRERAALGWAEALTHLPQGVSDEVYEEARAAFSEQELADLTAAVVSINAWNRLGVGYRFSPILQQAQQKAS